MGGVSTDPVDRTAGSARQAGPDGNTRPIRGHLGWLGVAAWLAADLAGPFVERTPSGPAVAGVQSLLLLGLFVWQARAVYGWSGFVRFFVVAFGIAFAMEASSIATGFPFGFYEHLTPGPRFLRVPLFVPLGWAVLAWFAWQVTSAIVRPAGRAGGAGASFAMPVIGALVYSGFDLSYDAIGSTVRGMWAYRTPGPWFGVPLGNFAGWLLTVFLIFGAFRLIEPTSAARAPTRRTILFQGCVVWLGMAAQYPLWLALAPAGVATAGTRSYSIADVYGAMLLTSLFAIAAFALIGIFRLLEATPATNHGA